MTVGQALCGQGRMPRHATHPRARAARNAHPFGAKAGDRPAELEHRARHRRRQPGTRRPTHTNVTDQLLSIYPYKLGRLDLNQRSPG